VTVDREDLIKSSWTDNAAAWTESVRQKRIASRALVTDAAVLAAVRARTPSRVLDIGCGEGWLCRVLQGHEIETVGFDGTRELIERARAASPGLYHVLTYEQFADNPEAVGSGYDVAVCNFSLLGEDIGAVIRGATEVLGPGGVIVLQTVHPCADLPDGCRYEDGWRMEEFGALGSDFHTPMPWYFRTVGSWIRAFTAPGLDLIECAEPVHPESGQPVSLLLTAGRAAKAQ
jgi:2-polyprenyl-3-methyl-5-hydroxy-6-metoxy-1,4-benzoquinol methylase